MIEQCFSREITDFVIQGNPHEWRVQEANMVTHDDGTARNIEIFFPDDAVIKQRPSAELEEVVTKPVGGTHGNTLKCGRGC